MAFKLPRSDGVNAQPTRIIHSHWPTTYLRANPARPSLIRSGWPHPKGIRSLRSQHITYVDTQQGWLYLAAILDVYSRKIVGWAMDETMSRKLCMDALQMAVLNREPDAGLLHHSDRGSQYASGDYQQLLDDHGMTCSMSRKGNCWDNAPMESFFGTLKTESLHRTVFATRNDARQEIFEFIEVFYNRQRKHSTLDFVSPAEFEMAHAA